MPWWSTTVAIGRRLGHAVFFVVVAVVFAVSVGLGVAGAKDAIDKQPVVWGTFTRERCEPAPVGTHKNCRSSGDWVSDDGSIVKKGIYLDGSPVSDGRARASFQATGLLNDTDNNTVHVRLSSRITLWLPWALAATTVGLGIYYNRRWKRLRTHPDELESDDELPDEE